MALWGRTQYEDFQPMSEWMEEQGADILVLHVPGFSKNQLKITSVQSSRIIRVSGEKPKPNDNKLWSRFNEIFAVPQNCDMNKIDGKFLNGVLTLRFPKPITKQPSTTTTEEEPPKTTQDQVPKSPKTTQDQVPKPPITTQDQVPKPPITTQDQVPKPPKTTQDQVPPPPKADSPPSVVKEGAEIKGAIADQKPTIMVEPKAQQKETEGKNTGDSLGPKEVLKEQTSQKAAPSVDPMKQKGREAGKNETNDDQNKLSSIKEAADPKEKKTSREQDEESSKKIKESMEKDHQQREEMMMSKKRKESMMVKKTDESCTAAAKTLMEKEKSSGGGFGEFAGTTRSCEERPTRRENLFGEKIKEVKNAAVAAGRSVREFATDLSEERQTLVNIGVAVLAVVIALGTYISIRRNIQN